MMERVVTFPRMGVYTDFLKELMEEMGIDVMLPPPISEDTVKWGCKHSPNMFCYPFKITLGNFKEALEEQLNHKIIVPKYCELMGAIGMAILAKENKPKKTNFRGFKIKDLDIDSEMFVCKNCANHCEIIKIIEEKEVVGHLGSRCGKWR